MHHTGLDHSLGPDGVDGVGQAGQPVTDGHEYVFDAAVLEFGADLEPKLGALPAVAGPQAEDVAGAVGGDRKGDGEGPVVDLPFADLGSVDDLGMWTFMAAVTGGG